MTCEVLTAIVFFAERRIFILTSRLNSVGFFFLWIERSDVFIREACYVGVLEIMNDKILYFKHYFNTTCSDGTNYPLDMTNIKLKQIN